VSGRRSPRWRRSAAVGLVVLATTASCGVPLDDEPRAITRVTQPAETTPQTAVAPAGRSITVYYLDEGSLEPAIYDVEEEPSVDDALRFLLSTAPPEGLISRIPPDTTLRGVDRDGSFVAIDLSSDIAVGGPNEKEAFAQLVFTAVEFDGIDEVSFAIAGEDVRVPTDNANLDVVSADDFGPPLSPR
jgi:spore germination protein GerM